MGSIQPMVFSGRVGNVIHYKMGDKYYMRSMPRKFKQTRATKARALEFGRASSLGAVIRGLLQTVIRDPSDKKMHRRLVAVLFEWIQSQNIKEADQKNTGTIGSFQFDEQKAIQDRWKVAVQIENPSPGEVQLYIPAFVPDKSIVAPARTQAVICRIAVVAIDIKSGLMSGQTLKELNFDFNKTMVPEQTIPMKLSTPKNNLVLIGMSLTYLKKKGEHPKENTNKAFMPAGILEAKIVGV